MRKGLKGLAWGGAVLLLLAASPRGAFAALVDLAPGELFPDLEFEGLLGSEDYAALGLPRAGGAFRLGEIPGEVLVLEFFNKSCVPCQRQVREVQTFYEETLGRGLGGRVRLLAAAAGNQAKYLDSFRKARGLTYPITADPTFDQWRKIGEPGRTPFTVFLRRRGSGWTLAQHHFGGQDAAEIGEIALTLLEGGPDAPAVWEEHRPAANRLLPPVDEEARRLLAQALLSRVGGRRVTVDVLDLPGDGRVYRAPAAGGRSPLFARVGSRAPVCAVCHAVHFLFAFDRDGRVLGFAPIQVTKWGNEAWSDEEAARFEARLRGRRMGELTFDENVDAVATATISSSLIFDEIRRSAELLGQLR